VGLKLSVVNQNGDTVMKGMWSTLVAFQPEAG